MLSQSSSRNLLENPIGPVLRHDSNPYKSYEKDRSPSRLSIESEQQLKRNNSDGIKMSVHEMGEKKKTINFNIARRKSTRPQQVRVLQIKVKQAQIRLGKKIRRVVNLKNHATELAHLKVCKYTTNEILHFVSTQQVPSKLRKLHAIQG
ncbi:unnamed protein product (macronuclear) [Paramecium tetraurelia]|uniref:Uncharacterized protein n=1 Tax=Paramecium tetraurelia TaxID=5888 RepID=A0DK65_PARTE|nr:uncharacterized protein GSPATT00017761001 [Paramecium tetraurelia]CAK83432.1 unnamed protein product [Paramecium tetraurelia]|eukprot:XP_001450829.1 hypothetical protein (macronuclear) [Paramecium tetraurelia strain d4-2]